ncbi:hypothetical protein PoB_000201400 [Plakobranchus ocellatus]|uniref:Uncharacterized protein n=1 Tax=Plakobranchus ocellatus TaxID=259542 RepID=A0AAV3XXD4_9GAST|nr:hypothetical protein PoB_000201400 [Plakobranchus ocellatus]
MKSDHNEMISGFQVFCQARVLVARLKTATEKSLRSQGGCAIGCAEMLTHRHTSGGSMYPLLLKDSKYPFSKVSRHFFFSCPPFYHQYWGQYNQNSPIPVPLAREEIES